MTLLCITMVTLFVAWIPIAGASTCWGYLSRSPSCYTPYGSVLNTTHARSVVDCARACGDTDTCQSLWFDKVTSTCITNAGVLGSSIPGCPATQIYAQLNIGPDICHPPPSTPPTTSPPVSSGSFYMSDACTTNNDCTHIENAECRGGICWCLAGYSFNNQHAKCDTSCQNGYGTTYQWDKNKVLNGFNIDTHNGMPSFEDCLNACTAVTSYTCLLAEYKASTGDCYLGTDTALTQPAAYADGTSLKYSIYQRDCLLTSGP